MITFDDSLQEQYLAFDILDSLSIPYICFATVQPLLSNVAHNVHKMHEVYSVLSDIDIFNLLSDRYPIDDFSFDLKLLNEEYRYDSLLKQRLNSISILFLNLLVRMICKLSFCIVCPSEQHFIDNLYMKHHHLIELANLGMLGSHTISHRALATLQKDLTHEIAGSRDYLQNLTGKPINTISYPYGGPGSVNSNVVDTALLNGMSFGFTMNRGLTINPTS